MHIKALNMTLTVRRIALIPSCGRSVVSTQSTRARPEDIVHEILNRSKLLHELLHEIALQLATEPLYVINLHGT